MVNGNIVPTSNCTASPLQSPAPWLTELEGEVLRGHTEPARPLIFLYASRAVFEIRLTAASVSQFASQEPLA